MKKFLIILIGVLALAGIIYMTYPYIIGLKLRKDTLVSCRISTGGGMLGGSSSQTLRKQKDGTVIYETTKRETHAHREVTTVYPASEEDLAYLKELVLKYNLYAASKRPYSKFQVLDGDTSTLSIGFENDYFSVSDQQVLTNRMEQGWQEVQSYLSSLAKGEGVTTLEPQSASLYLRSGYTLHFIVKDAFDGRLEEILGKDAEVTPVEDWGILLNTGRIDVPAGTEMTDTGEAGEIVWDPESGNFYILYSEHVFPHPVYVTAALDGYVSYAIEHIQGMEGLYSLRFNQ